MRSGEHIYVNRNYHHIHIAPGEVEYGNWANASVCIVVADSKRMWSVLGVFKLYKLNHGIL